MLFAASSFPAVVAPSLSSFGRPSPSSSQKIDPETVTTSPSPSSSSFVCCAGEEVGGTTMVARGGFVGDFVGDFVVGGFVGRFVGGDVVGFLVGTLVGKLVGKLVGTLVGTLVGILVGVMVISTTGGGITSSGNTNGASILHVALPNSSIIETPVSSTSSTLPRLFWASTLFAPPLPFPPSNNPPSDNSIYALLYVPPCE
mmetsp:Transcript_11206/g.21098  ORF Transcript_11206/g.21098 Transcript_11206/m.21098 type:complete len:200 (-) Transcript_11206:212-811(-)